MEFRLSLYSNGVREILELDGGGNRLIPLISGQCSSAETKKRLQKANADILFPGARSGKAALAGLWLYFSCFEESHCISQELHSREGSYWHGILHRQEPDNWNAKYWFRQVGTHPIFPQLREAAAEIAAAHGNKLSIPARWDAAWFADLCDAAAADLGHPHRETALEIQRAEWQLLFAWCALPAA